MTYGKLYGRLMKVSQIRNNKLEIIKRIIFNNPVTIVYWNEGNKTIVKTCKGDSYDPEYGFLMAYFQEHSDLSKTQCSNFMKQLRDDYEESLKQKEKSK